MSDVVIRALRFADLDAAVNLSTIIGWNQRPEDWRMLLRLAPAGAFAAVIDAHIVGTSIGIDYGGFAWIAMMLVDPAYRGRGLGGRLLEAAIAAVPSHLRIRLDATPLGRPLYQRYGFADEALLSRHVSEDSDRRAASAAEVLARHAATRPLTASDLTGVIEQDKDTFGGSRGAVLEWAFRQAPQYAYVMRGDDGLIHYCLGRQGRQFDQIGPVVASSEDIARALVNVALARAEERPVAIDAFDGQTAFSEGLRRRGFFAQRPLVRICRRAAQAGAPDATACAMAVREFAILGPEFA
jgi:GNAT superfamily N-acetyltransferase